MYAEWAPTMCWNDISNPQPQTAEVQNLCMPEMLKEWNCYISVENQQIYLPQPTEDSPGFLKLNEPIKDL